MAYEEVYEEKRKFVEGELTEMLRAATGGYVERCEYEREGSEETVHVFMSIQPVGVNVTADSPWGIAKDVMRALAERY